MLAGCVGVACPCFKGYVHTVQARFDQNTTLGTPAEKQGSFLRYDSHVFPAVRVWGYQALGRLGPAR